MQSSRVSHPRPSSSLHGESLSPKPELGIEFGTWEGWKRRPVLQRRCKLEKKKKGIGLAGGKDTLAEARKGIPGGDIWAPACRGWSWGGGRNPGWCGTCSLLCLCKERHSQLSNDSWARAADGITALGEKLITNMNQPCLFLLAGL